MDTVLIVDDDQFFRIWIRDFLVDKHLRVLSAQDAEMGLKLLMGETIDTVIMDIYLPGVNGLELLERMKGIDPDLPIIMVTGSESLEVAISSLERGVYDYFKKPFELPKLYDTISQAIEHYHLNRERKRRLVQLELFEKSITELTVLTERRIRGEVDPSPYVLIREVIELIGKGIQIEIVSLMLLHEKTGELRIADAIGLSPEVIANTRQRLGDGIAGWVAQTGEALFIKDIRVHPLFSESNFSQRYSTNSFMSVPIKLNKKVIGVLSGTNKLWGGELTDEDFSLFKSFASVLTLALSNVRLFRPSRPATVSAKLPPSPPPAPKPRRVLIIEDDRMAREMIKDSLEFRGYQILIAKDGIEGLEKAQAEIPDLIILDIMMPKLDGFEVSRRLKSDPVYRSIPIIVLSAKEHFEDCGADLYMHKPFQPFHLVNNVAKALAQREATPAVS